MSQKELNLVVLADLNEAAELTDEANLTWEELAQVLGVDVDKNGCFNNLELINACLGVMSNEAVRALPQEKRIRVIRSAGDALSVLVYGGKE